jgi:transposase
MNEQISMPLLNCLKRRKGFILHLRSKYKEICMRTAYATDLSNVEWDLIKDLFQNYRVGFKPIHSRREILNAIFYVLRTGCQWCNLPHDFPPWKAVYNNFRNWESKELFKKMNDRLRALLREREGRQCDPSGAIIDSQTVRTTEKGGFAEDMMEPKKLKEEKGIFSLIHKGCCSRQKLQQRILVIRKVL